MAVQLREVVGYLDATLEIDRFRDHARNGLQVEGTADVECVVTGVSASAELISRAVERRADLIVVHHGLVWGGGLTRIAGPLARRLRLLLGNEVSLAAYHLPLDKHPRLGNNAGLCDALGLGATREPFGDVRGTPLGVAGTWSAPLTRDDAIARIAAGVGKPPFVFPHGPAVVQRSCRSPWSRPATTRPRCSGRCGLSTSCVSVFRDSTSRSWPRRARCS